MPKKGAPRPVNVNNPIYSKQKSAGGLSGGPDTIDIELPVGSMHRAFESISRSGADGLDRTEVKQLMMRQGVRVPKKAFDEAWMNMSTEWDSGAGRHVNFEQFQAWMAAGSSMAVELAGKLRAVHTHEGDLDEATLRSMFKKLESSTGSGKIDGVHVKQLAVNLGYKLENAEFRQVMREMDPSGSKEVTWVQFMEFMRNSHHRVAVRLRTLLVASGSVRTDLLTVFRRIDVDKEGMNMRRVAQLARAFGVELSQTESETAFEEMDQNGDGSCEFEEFYQWWMGPSLIARIVKDSVAAGARKQLKEVFEKIDLDGNGTLEKKEVARAFKDLGAELPAVQLDVAFGEMRYRNESSVKFQHFCQWMESESLLAIKLKLAMAESPDSTFSQAAEGAASMRLGDETELWVARPYNVKGNEMIGHLEFEDKGGCCVIA